VAGDTKKHFFFAKRRKFTVSDETIMTVITRSACLVGPAQVVAVARALKTSAPIHFATLFMLLLSLTVVAYVSGFAAAFVNEFRPAFSTPRNYPPKDA
jgi:hypothetical protein